LRSASRTRAKAGSPPSYPPTMTRIERIFGGVAALTLNMKVAAPSFEVLAATFTAPSASSRMKRKC